MGINYNRTGDRIEITIRDMTGAKLESHTCGVNEKKKYASILKYLKDKFGFAPEIDVDESVNAQVKNFNWWD